MSNDLDTPLFDEAPATGSSGRRLVWLAPPLLAATIFTTGTGGSFDPCDTSLQDSTVASHSPSEDKDGQLRDPSDAFSDPAGELLIIRRWLSLSITELAEVMRVQRPTIYAWMKSQYQPNSNNRARIHRLHNLAMSWKNLSSRPIGKAATKHPDIRESLIELLRRNTLDDARIMLALKSLAPENADPRTKLEKITEDAGLNARQHDQASRVVDIETLLG